MIVPILGCRLPTIGSEKTTMSNEKTTVSANKVVSFQEAAKEKVKEEKELVMEEKELVVEAKLEGSQLPQISIKPEVTHLPVLIYIIVIIIGNLFYYKDIIFSFLK